MRASPCCTVAHSAAQVPDILRKELAGVCKACFSTNSTAKHAQVVAQYRQQFVSQLNPEAPAFPTTLGELAGGHCSGSLNLGLRLYYLSLVSAYQGSWLEAASRGALRTLCML